MTEYVLCPFEPLTFTNYDQWSSLGDLEQAESDVGSDDIEDVTSVKPVKRVRTNLVTNNTVLHCQEGMDMRPEGPSINWRLSKSGYH